MKNSAWKRRDILKASGLLAASAPLAGLTFKNKDSGLPLSLSFRSPAAAAVSTYFIFSSFSKLDLAAARFGSSSSAFL
jgi:hypothetical protein